MADTKVSGLSAITGVNIDSAADVTYIVDTSATTSKKVVIDELAVAMKIGTWALVANNGSASISASHNVASVNRTAAGLVTVTFTTAFGSANYAAVATSVSAGFTANITTQAAGSLVVNVRNGANADADANFSLICMGSQ
jgi:hypothetical protein